MCGISAVEFSTDSQILGDARLLLINSLCHLCSGLQVHNYGSCCRRKLCRKKVYPKTFSYDRTLFSHRIDVCQEVHGNISLILESRIQLLDSIMMLFLDCEDRFIRMCDLHTVLHAADHFISLFYQLFNVMLQSRFTLRRIYQDIAMLQLKVCRKLRIDLRIQLSQRCLCQIDIQLYASRESCPAHTYDTSRLYHVQFAGVFRHIDRNKFIWLFCRRFNNDPVVSNLCYFSVHAGKNVCSQPCRCSNESAFFHVRPNLNTGSTWCTNVLTQ